MNETYITLSYETLRMLIKFMEICDINDFDEAINKLCEFYKSGVRE